jgi:AcrR family transcriptional regulator
MPSSKQSTSSEGVRPRGRPRLDVDPDAVADAVAELFEEGGPDAVSIVDAAEKLSISRATLYRAVPTKQHLLGILFERSTRELLGSTRTVINDVPDPRDQLNALIRLHVDAAIRMRRYMPVFFGGADLPSDVFERWHIFTQEFESLWIEVVAANMRAGSILEGDPVLATKLLLGQCIWVSRWFRADSPYDAETIANAAIGLLRHGTGVDQRDLEIHPLPPPGQLSPVPGVDPDHS